MEIIIRCSDDCRGSKDVYGKPIKELVRCKDCRYWWGESEQCMDEIGFARKWKADDYCSNGEMREDDN